MSSNFGSKKMKIGEMIKIITIAARLPYVASEIASYPFPDCSSSWPGRIERIVSSSGAPRKILGMKSMKV